MTKIGKNFLKGKISITILGFLISFISVFCISSQVFASVNVQSLVDRNEMGMGDTLTWTISVQSSDSVNPSEPRLNDLQDFDLVNSWTSTASSSKLMQGPGGMQFETVRKFDFNYMITPKKTGNLTIPSIEIQVDGKSYSTKPISISVSAQGSGAATPPRGRQFEEESEEEQIFNQLLQRRGLIPNQGAPKNLPKNANEVLSIRLELDKTEAFEGEQIVANWYIYTRGNLLSLDRLKFPDLKGFWKEIIEEVPALNFTQEVINGVVYRKALLASHALFPIKPGTAIVDEYKVKGTVQVPTNPFSQFGLGQTYSFNRASERVKIKVNPIPTEGRPQDFAGAVGQFEVQALTEGTQFPVNQPFSLRVRFEGSGNAKLIELPNLNLPSSVEVFDTKSESKYFKNGRSYKQFEVLIIPRQEGDIEIPSMKFSIFDPQTKKFVTKETNPISLKIIPNKNESNVSTGQDSRLQTVEKKIAAKKPELPGLILNWQMAGKSIPYSFYFVLYALVAVVLGFKARSEFGFGKKKKDLKIILQSRMKKINLHLQSQDWRKAATEMTNLFYVILGEVAGLGGANQEIGKLLEAAPPSLRRELGDEIKKMIEIFQVMSFAPEEAVGDLKNPEVLKKNITLAQNLMNRAIELSEKTSGD